MTISTKTEYRAIASLSSILAIRMLGLFMILPVFSIYAQHLNGSTPTFIGLALGIYGLTQALLQMPLGMLSDKIGRKPVIVLGLIIFAIGSIIAALSTSIHGVIIGRALQGAGAIGSTIIAFVADLSQPEHRTRAMAMVGMTIGMSFMLAMILGPLLAIYIHVSGIFWATALFAAIGIIVLLTTVPNQVKMSHHYPELTPQSFLSLLQHPTLLRLNYGIAVLHAVFTASFIVIPIILSHSLGLKMNQQWYIYLSVLILAFALMLPFIIAAEKYHKMRPLFLGAILILGLAQLSFLLFHQSLMMMLCAMLLYFAAFNFLEASLPSLISKAVSPTQRGTAIGIYSSSQFFGIFIGGTAGGWIYGHYGIAGLFGLCIVLTASWFFVVSIGSK